jgi:TP901 family phage tail tape measure protein
VALRTVGVRLTAEVSSYMAGMRRAASSTDDFGKRLAKAADSKKLDAVADRAAVAGVGMAGAFAYATSKFMEFDKQMSSVAAATGKSGEELEKLRQAAMAAGQETKYSATEAAEGIEELAKAGVNTADILSGGLSGALSLASAGGLDVAEAAETAATAMVQFNLKGNQVEHVADLLAAGAGKAQGSVHDLGYALKAGGLVASNMGISVEDATGALAAFASAGLIGSDAGTSFKSMIQSIQNPSGKSADLMKDLGLSVYDATGKFVGLENFAGQLQDRLGGLQQAQRDAAMATIFGSDGIRAATVLYKEGAAGVKEWRDNVNDQGFAAEVAATKTDNLAGDIERLQGTIDNLLISAGSGGNDGLRILTKSAEALVSQVAALPGGLTSALTVMSGVGGVALLAMAGWVKMRGAVRDTVEELNKTGPAGERAGKALQATTKWAGRAAGAFVAAQIAGAALDAAFGKAAPNVERMSAALAEMAKTGKSGGELDKIFGKGMENLPEVSKYAGDAAEGFWAFGAAVTSFIPGASQLQEWLFGTSWESATEDMKGFDQALTQTMGGMTSAAEAGKLWNQVLSKSGKDTEELKKLLPGTWGQLELMQKAAHGDAQAMKDLGWTTETAASATKILAEGTSDAAEAATSARDAFQELAEQHKAAIDPAFALIQSQEKLVEKQKAYNKAVKDHGRDSKEAQSASRDLAMEAINLQDAVGKLGAGFTGKLTPSMLATFRAAKLTEPQIKEIERQLTNAGKAADNYDGDYAARTTAPGAADAERKLRAALTAATEFDGSYRATSSAPGVKEAKTQIDKAWAAANHFDGKYKANLSSPGAINAKQQAADAWAQAKGFAGNYHANLYVDGKTKVDAVLADLMIKQRALQTGLTYTSARQAIQKDLDRTRQRKATGGAVTGPGSGTSDSIPAWLSNGEHVWTAAEVSKLGGQQAMSSLRSAVRSGKRVEFGDDTPGFRNGGPVIMRFATDVSKTKIPDIDSFAGIGNSGPGGAGWRWMVSAVKAAFPGVGVYSTFRPGSRTLSGNRSYHSVGRAVDFAPSRELAEWINRFYFTRTRELITPWNSLNIHNGARHTYTGAVFRQHNFAGGNAHDHWAMANGGVINEPIVGVGSSGRTYSFGEYGPETVTPGLKRYQADNVSNQNVNLSVTFAGPIGSQRELQNWLAGSVDELKRKGRI